MIEKTEPAFMIPAQLKQCGGQVVQQYGEMTQRGKRWHQEPMCRCGCFQGEHGIRWTQGARGLG